MMVDEQKNLKKPNLYPRDEDESDESTWDMPSKKDIADFEDDDLELDEKKNHLVISRRMRYFPWKMTKITVSSTQCRPRKDGRRVGKWFNTFIDATLPEELTKDLPDPVKEVLKKVK